MESSPTFPWRAPEIHANRNQTMADISTTIHFHATNYMRVVYLTLIRSCDAKNIFKLLCIFCHNGQKRAFLEISGIKKNMTFAKLSMDLLNTMLEMTAHQK